jgi:biopolymer transport protein ExbD
MKNNPQLKIVLIVVIAVLIGFSALKYFIYNTTMSTTTGMKLSFPQPDDKIPGSPPVISFLLVEDKKIFTYQNAFENGKWISQQEVATILRNEREKDSGIVVIIKPLISAPYKSIVDMLDQMTINKIERFSLLDPTPNDLDLIKHKHSKP